MIFNFVYGRGSNYLNEVFEITTDVNIHFINHSWIKTLFHTALVPNYVANYQICSKKLTLLVATLKRKLKKYSFPKIYN